VRLARLENGLVTLLIAVAQVPLRAEDAGRVVADGESANAGSLVGRVLYDGEPPEPAKLVIPVRLRVRHDGLEFDTEELPERRRLMKRGIPDESLIVGEERGIANVFVWVTSKDVPIPKPPKGPLPPVTLRAVHGKLTPHVLAFWNVTSLEMVNDTGEGANFNVRGMHSNRVLADGQRVEIAAKRPMNLPSPVTSGIHPWFSAYVMAFKHPYFAVTGEDGRFKIADLPVGEWKFAIWHERTVFLPT
jgi:hypothetical protein